MTPGDVRPASSRLKMNGLLLMLPNVPAELRPHTLLYNHPQLDHETPPPYPPEGF
jgi:hypothetical protein